MNDETVMKKMNETYVDEHGYAHHTGAVEVDANEEKLKDWAADARFVYLRGEIDEALEGGKTADAAYVPFDEMGMEEQERWMRVARHLENLVLGDMATFAHLA